MADKFLIAPYDQDSGQTTDYKPWIISDTAFQELNNAYVFRGRVRKRFGSSFLQNDQLGTRLRVKLANQTNGVGDTPAATFVPRSGLNPLVTPALGQMFSIGTEVFTVNVLGSPANLLRSGASTSATFNATTGELIVTGATALADIYYYPALPVMGLLTAELSLINDEFIVGFDTKFSYYYNAGWQRLDGEVVPGAAVWNGSDSQFFWGTTWTGTDPSDRVFFVTNFNQNEPHYMRYLAPLSSIGQWNNFRPQLDAAATFFLDSSRMLLVFHNRLIALNTWETTPGGQRNYVNRARYSQVGSPLAANAWYAQPGLGNAIDAATTESIITAEFLKDRLIVYFERSTWELAYTGNQAYPFTWLKINTELGAESTHSIVPFDKLALGIGNVGIHACNGANVERIDTKIPQEVFKIHNVDAGVSRVYGIRDYYTELVYWTFPALTADTTAPFPGRILVYNYRNNTWSFNDDSITCFGYYQPVTSIIWNSTNITWNDTISWGSGDIQAKFRQVIAGNQEGFTFMCNADCTTNASALQITDMTVTVGNIVSVTSINHNLSQGDYIYFSGITSTGNLALINSTIYPILSVPDANTFTLAFDTSVILAGVYKGNGLMARVSKISIKTKQYNFYAKQNRNAYLSKVDFLVDKTGYGQIQVAFFDSTATVPVLQDSSANGTLLGTGNLDTFAYPSVPFEATAERVWHPVYTQSEGNVVQFWLNLNDAQMRDTLIMAEDFQMHAMLITAMPTSARIY